MPKSDTQFKKGVSGNPSGRPKVDPEFTKLLKTHSVQALKTIISFANGGCEEESNQLKAAQYIIDRAYGKPAQAVNLGDQDGQPLSIQVIVREKSASD